MSTFFMTSGQLGLPLASLPLHQSLPQHRSLDGVSRAHLELLKSGGCAGSDMKTADDRVARAGTGRCRSPISQPLRHRQLPASFWQEPNVPRGHPGYPHLPHPFHFPHWPPPRSSSPSPAGEVSNPGSRGKQGGQVHKEFLERLQSAQTRGYDLAASRFPITQFLFYNYGLRSYLDSAASSSSQSTSPSSTGNESTSVGALTAHPPPHHHSLHPLTGSPPACSTFRLEERPEKPTMAKSSSRGEGQTLAVTSSVCGGNSGVGLTFPTLCPYLGYNCPNLHGVHPHRFWDCVLGQAAATSPSLSSLSSLSSDVVNGRGGDGSGGVLWKGGRSGGRSAGAFPARYHPFANA